MVRSRQHKTVKYLYGITFSIFSLFLPFYLYVFLVLPCVDALLGKYRLSVEE